LSKWRARNVNDQAASEYTLRMRESEDRRELKMFSIMVMAVIRRRNRSCRACARCAWSVAASSNEKQESKTFAGWKPGEGSSHVLHIFPETPPEKGREFISATCWSETETSRSNGVDLLLSGRSIVQSSNVQLT